jgi:hypothetical protein
VLDPLAQAEAQQRIERVEQRPEDRAVGQLVRELALLRGAERRYAHDVEALAAAPRLRACAQRVDGHDLVARGPERRRDATNPRITLGF